MVCKKKSVSANCFFFRFVLKCCSKQCSWLFQHQCRVFFRGENDDHCMSCICTFVYVFVCCCIERQQQQQTHHSFWHNVSFSLQLFIVVANVIYRNREIIFNPPLPSTDTYPHTVAVFFYNSRKTALFIQKFIAWRNIMLRLICMNSPMKIDFKRQFSVVVVCIFFGVLWRLLFSRVLLFF